MGILTVAVVTKPFTFEGRGHMRVAEAGIAELRKCTDAILVIPNNNLKKAADSKITFINAFAVADSVLVETVENVIELIQNQAQINVDFADVTAVLKDSGMMHIGICRNGGAERAGKIYDAIRQSRLLDTTIDNAQRVLLCITASDRVGLDEIENLSEAVRNAVHPDANIIIGLRLDERMGDDMQAMIIATAIADTGN
jgi:cell division protein FtsZ